MMSLNLYQIQTYCSQLFYRFGNIGIYGMLFLDGVLKTSKEEFFRSSLVSVNPGRNGPGIGL